MIEDDRSLHLANVFPVDLDTCGTAPSIVPNGICEALHGRSRDATDLDDHVSLLQRDVIGWAALLDGQHDGADQVCRDPET